MQSHRKRYYGVVEAKHIKSIGLMVQTLSESPLVLGLVEYGSTSVTDAEVIAEYDLIVVLKHKHPNLESLHFYVDGIPVDLNLRSLDEIRTMQRAAGFESVLLDGRVIYDPGRRVLQAIQDLGERHRQMPPETMSAESIAFARHGTKHIFDKVERRIHSNPTLCAFLLHQNVYWLIHNYLALRGVEFKGEPVTLEFLRQNEPETYGLLERFYASRSLQEQLSLAISIAHQTLDPVGGMWRDDEVLVFGDAEAGQEMFVRLFGPFIRGAK